MPRGDDNFDVKGGGVKCQQSQVIFGFNNISDILQLSDNCNMIIVNYRD